jgi:hypothetical protein
MGKTKGLLRRTFSFITYEKGINDETLEMVSDDGMNKELLCMG